MLLIVLLTSCNISSTPESSQEVPAVTAPSTAKEPSVEHDERIRVRISLPLGSQLVAFGEGSIWVSNPKERNISRIDAGTGKLVGPLISLDFEPREIAFGEGAAWVLSTDRKALPGSIPNQTRWLR